MRLNRDSSRAAALPLRWDDLEAFSAIAAGVRAGKSLQQIAEDPFSGTGGARMLYFRLGRLERALGRRLVDRRPWGREAYLTAAGVEVERAVTDLVETRRRLREHLTEPEVPVLRIATHATLVSTLLPAVLKEHRHRAHAGRDFHLELLLVQAPAESLAAVNDARADMGLYLTFPDFDRIATPRNVRREVLGTTEVVVICQPTHPFARRSVRGRPAPVRFKELVDECVIVRGYVDSGLLPAGTTGRRIIVPHTLDKLAYVRLGIGVCLLPRLAYELAGSPTDVRPLPLVPPVRGFLTLLRPRKRVRPVSDPAEHFLDDLRTAALRVVRGKVRTNSGGRRTVKSGPTGGKWRNSDG